MFSSSLIGWEKFPCAARGLQMLLQTVVRRLIMVRLAELQDNLLREFGLLIKQHGFVEIKHRQSFRLPKPFGWASFHLALFLTNKLTLILRQTWPYELMLLNN